MAYSLIDHVAAGSTDGNDVTTSSIDTTGANLIVIAVADRETTYTLSDSKGNTYTQMVTNVGNTERLTLWYCASPVVGSGHTFTVTRNSGLIFPAIFVGAFAGARASGPFDNQNNAVSFSPVTSLATGSFGPSEDNELIVSALASSAGGSYSVDSGFTILDQSGLAGSQHYGGALAYKIQTAAASINATWTQSSSSIVVAIAGFKTPAPSQGTGFFALMGA